MVSVKQYTTIESSTRGANMLDEVVTRLDALAANWARPCSVAVSYSPWEEGKEQAYQECAQELYQLIAELTVKDKRDYLK